MLTVPSLFETKQANTHLWNDAVSIVVFSHVLCVVESAAYHTATWCVQVQILIHVLCFPVLWPSFPVLQSAFVTYVQSHAGKQSKKEIHFISLTILRKAFIVLLNRLVHKKAIVSMSCELILETDLPVATSSFFRKKLSTFWSHGLMDFLMLCAEFKLL